MALGAIGALPPVPSAAAGIPGGITQLAEAFGQFPEMQQKAAMDRLTSQNQITQAAQARLKQLADAAQRDPALAGNKNFQAQIKQLYGAMNEPVPMTAPDQAGAQRIDISAIRPVQPFEDMPADIKEKGLALPPGPGRDALWAGYNVPDSAKTAPMQTSLNPSMVNAAQREVDQAAMQLSMGKMDPARFKGIVEAHRTTLGDAADYYLTPDFLSQNLSTAAQSEIDKLNALGIHLRNEDAYKNKYVQLQMDKLDETRRFDSARIQQMRTQDAIRLQILQQGQERITQAQMRIDTAQQNANTNSGRLQIDALSKAASYSRQVYNTTLGQYNRVLGQIQAATNAQGDGASIDPALLSQATALKKQLDGMQNSLDQADEWVNSLPSRTTASGVGPATRVQPVSAHGSIVRSGYKNGKRVHQYSDGSVLYDDGSPVK